MFHSSVSPLTNLPRTAVRAIGSMTTRTPWLVQAGILLAFFLVV